MATTDARDELFDPEFLDRLRAVFLRLRKRRALRKKGAQSTPATGFTREFKDFRHYTPNDDYRSIDWRLYARLDRLFIRLYEEVQEFHVHILIDTSVSMDRPHPEKRRTAQKLAVALGYLGLVGQHRVSLYSMSDKVTTELPPLKGQGSIQKIIDQVAGLEFSGTTDLDACFRQFRPSRQRFGIIFVLSDLFGKDIATAPNALSNSTAWAGEPHVLQIIHPEEASPSLEGEIEIVDSETGEKRRLFFTKRERERYEAAFAGLTEELRAQSMRRQIDYVQWPCDAPFEEMFLNVLSRGSTLSGA